MLSTIAAARTRQSADVRTLFVGAEVVVVAAAAEVREHDAVDVRYAVVPALRRRDPAALARVDRLQALRRCPAATSGYTLR